MREIVSSRTSSDAKCLGNKTRCIVKSQSNVDVVALPMPQ